MKNNSDLILNTKKIIGNNLISIILFGSYARGDYSTNSDIDILLIVNEKLNEKLIEKELKKINNKIQILLLTKKEFKNRVLTFNHQLITLFYDGKILYDKTKFYYKMENLFLALNRKKEFKLKFRNRIISLDKLRRIKSFI